MENIYELITNIKPQNIIGEGTYSLVLDTSPGKVQKITSEYNSATVGQIKDKTNRLVHEGVNVPKIDSVDVFKVETGSVIQNLKSILRYSESNKLTDILQEYAKGFTNNDGKYEIVCLNQDKVEGTNCFVTSNNTYINLVNKRIQNVRKLTSELRIRLETELNKNLDYFCSIPKEHYKKFLVDAKAVLKENLNIDNVLKTNFMYNSEKGFYFIDLGGLEDTFIKGESNLFNFTINNVCEMVFANTPCLSPEIVKKQLDLCEKLKEAVDDVIKDDYIKEQFEEYNSEENLFKQLINNSLQQAPEDMAEKYYQKLTQKNLSDNSLQK